MSPKELLEQLNALDEHTRIEAKTASELGKSVLETVCAFANEPGLEGGWILLGARAVEDALFRQYEAVGLPDPDRASRELASQCATIFNRPIRVEIESGIVNGRHLLSVYVPEAEASAKPIFFQNRALPAAAFRRIGSSNVHCTEDDLAVFYQDRRGETYDGTLIRDADLSALDPASIAEYRQMRRESYADAEELRWNDQEMLHALRCISRDGEVFRPTIAGLLLFGTSAALRRWFPVTRVDYIRVPGREWIQDPERRFDTVELRAPLIPLIRRAHAAILDDLPKAFSLPPGQLQRKDIPLIPDRVIREAIVNAVMHRNYRIQGSIQIIRYSNRLEIRSPGHSLIAEDRLGEPGSETRNPALAGVLRDTNLAETKGSGIRVMRELMTANGLTPPTFESDRERNLFVVTLLFHHFLSADDWDWLRGFRELELSDEEARALVFVREAGAITNAAYRMINRVDVLNASTHLRRLRDRGLLRQRGKGAETYYLPTEKLLAPWQARVLAAQTAGTEPSQRTNLPPERSNLPTATQQPPGSNAATSTERSDLAPPLPDDSLLAALPSLLRLKLANLRSRVPQPEMVQLVFELCSVRPFSTEELALLLGRNRTHVQVRLVTPMLRAGRLAMTIPDQPNHPQQKYRAIAA